MLKPNRDEVEEAWIAIYKLSKLDPPRFRWVKSPTALFAKTRKDPNDPRAATARSMMRTLNAPLYKWLKPNGQWGHLDIAREIGGYVNLKQYYRPRRYSAYHVNKLRKEYRPKGQKQISPRYRRILSILTAGSGWAWHGGKVCIIAQRGIEHRDVQRRLHSETGKALIYPDGTGSYRIHGVLVSEQIVIAPETLTTAQILHEANQTRRSIMIRRCNVERLIDEANYRLIHEDKYGKLWRSPLRTREQSPAIGRDNNLLEVVNGSPEPDGSYKKAWLQVPFFLETALEAVAWTYGVDPELYRKLKLRT